MIIFARKPVDPPGDDGEADEDEEWEEYTYDFVLGHGQVST